MIHGLVAVGGAKAVGSIARGVGFAIVGVLGLTIVNELQASAAKSVKIQVMEQVQKRNARIQQRELKQAALEGRLSAEHKERVAHIDGKDFSDDVYSCPIERLRCAL